MLPGRFNPKVSVLEYSENLDKLSKEELHGVLIAYEMRLDEEEGTSHLEIAFVASKKTNKEKRPSKAKTCTFTCKCEEKEYDEEGFSDGEYAYFTRKLKIGKGKFKARDCRLENPREKSSKPQNERTWKKKNTNNCALSLKAQNNKDVWYVDSSCSMHMIGDRKKFLSLKEKKDGTVSFGNNGSSNVIGSGTVSLGSKYSLAKNVLLVENMNHNLLSVGQMCD
eukprot:PITA_03984